MSVEINVEIHPRGIGEEPTHWVVNGSVRLRDGRAHKVFSVGGFHFPSKEDAEAYVRDNIANWSQGIQ